MFVFRKARSPSQVLSDLDRFLQENSRELIDFIVGEVHNPNEFSYSEIEELIRSGNVGDLVDWQQRYSAFVNEKLTPVWLSAIAAASYRATHGRITIDDSDVRVKEFLLTHGAELVQNLSEETRKAIAAIILHGQEEQIIPRRLARQIRPLIGLTARQAQANVTYQQRVYNELIAEGLSPQQASIRAEASAVRYASKQQRFRAETIVHTELAFAYNHGAHEGIQAAQRAGLMNRCEMVWTTAGSNRVCSRCMGLRGHVVGYSDEIGIQLPPIHPRCRCTIEYREVGSGSTNDDIKPRSDGLARHTPLTAQERADIVTAATRAYRNSDYEFGRTNTNPNFSKEVKTANMTLEFYGRTPNCQRCAVTFEARMRGFDVIARPSWGAGDTMRFNEQWLGAFDYSPADLRKCTGSTGGRMLKSATEIISSFGEGARAIVMLEVSDGQKIFTGGHVIVAECRKGTVVFGDPQTKEIAASYLFNAVKLSGVVVLRTDNLNFTDKTKLCCMNRSEFDDLKRSYSTGARFSRR